MSKLKQNELKSLRGRQVALVTKYVSALANQNDSLLGELKDKFIENLQIESKLDNFMGIEVARYPLFFDNLLEALGYQVHMGYVPTLSGTQPYERYHMALDSSKILVISDDPFGLFGSIADIQSLTTKPILGISHTTWTSRNNLNDNNLHGKWETDRLKRSKALGIGRLEIKNSKTILQGIELNPSNDNEKLREIANDVGLTSFLSLSVDNLPIYGAFTTKERKLLFQEKNVKNLLLESQKKGHELIDGPITNFTPDNALKHPNLLLDSLNKQNLVSTTNKIDITKDGEKYVCNNVLDTPQEAALYKTANVIFINQIKTAFKKIENLEKNVSEILLEVKKLRKDKYTAKYVIGTTSISPIQFQIEILAGEVSEEEILKKIAEINNILPTLSSYLKERLKHAITNLTEIPPKIKTRLLNSFK